VATRSAAKRNLAIVVDAIATDDALPSRSKVHTPSLVFVTILIIS